MKQQERRLSGIGTGIILSACFSFLMLVYAPLELYLTNISEFWIRITDLIFPITALFFACFTGLSLAMIIARLINKKLYHICLAIGFSLLIGAYIQGNFLIGNLPSMDGVTVCWNEYTAERIKSALAFAIPLFIMIILAIKLKPELFKKIITVASTCFLLLLAVTLSTLLITTDTEKPEPVATTVKNEFLMSSDKNLIVLILDTVDAKHFKQSLKNDTELEKELNGFVLYDNALAAYPYTTHSIPMIFSGNWYENDRNFQDYAAESISNSPFIESLKSKDYDIGFYEEPEFEMSYEQFGDIFSNLYPTQVTYSSSAIYQYVVKMAGVKFFPWDMKNYSWFLYEYSKYCRYTDSEYQDFSWSDKVFYDTLSQNNPIKTANEKCARIIHLEGAHVPYQYDKYLNIVNENATYQGNVDACATIIKQYIKRLKESNVYDNSAIIILADHGFSGTDQRDLQDQKGRMNPIVLVKGINENEPLLVSSAPISYMDIADGINKLTDGKSGSDIFKYKEGSDRTRRMLLYSIDDTNHMEEYITEGKADNTALMKSTGVIFEKKHSWSD